MHPEIFAPDGGDPHLDAAASEVAPARAPMGVDEAFTYGLGAGLVWLRH
jgi:hypothetical protein